MKLSQLVVNICLWISQVNAVGSLWSSKQTCFLLHAFYFNGLHQTVSQSIQICFNHVLADVVSSSQANTASNQTINMLSEHDMTFIAEMLIWHVRHVQMYLISGLQEYTEPTKAPKAASKRTVQTLALS